MLLNKKLIAVIATSIILLLSVFFFVNGKVRSDVVALCALIALLLCDILTPEEALSGFSNLLSVVQSFRQGLRK